jgi:hypothetical protein
MSWSAHLSAPVLHGLRCSRLIDCVVSAGGNAGRLLVMHELQLMAGVCQWQTCALSRRKIKRWSVVSPGSVRMALHLVVPAVAAGCHRIHSAVLGGGLGLGT